MYHLSFIPSTLRIMLRMNQPAIGNWQSEGMQKYFSEIRYKSTLTDTIYDIIEIEAKYISQGGRKNGKIRKNNRSGSFSS